MGHLASLHAGGAVTLWAAHTGACLWRCDAEKVSSVRLDPFDATRLLASTDTNIFFLAINGPQTSPPQSRMQSPRPGAGARACSPAEPIVQALLSPHDRGLVFLLYAREIVVVDTTAIVVCACPRHCFVR